MIVEIVGNHMLFDARVYCRHNRNMFGMPYIRDWQNVIGIFGENEKIQRLCDKMENKMASLLVFYFLLNSFSYKIWQEKYTTLLSVYSVKQGHVDDIINKHEKHFYHIYMR